MESDKLPSEVRKRAMDAVDSSGRRVTIGDVASKAGLKLNEAQRALQALAADTDGFLEVIFPCIMPSLLVGLLLCGRWFSMVVIVMLFSLIGVG